MARGEGAGGGSPFDMFFGGGGGNKQGQRGRNMDIELPVTLEDLYVGNEKAATVKRRSGVPQLQGQGPPAALRQLRAVPQGEENGAQARGAGDGGAAGGDGREQGEVQARGEDAERDDRARHAGQRGDRLQVRERAEAGPDPGRRRAQAEDGGASDVQA